MGLVAGLVILVAACSDDTVSPDDLTGNPLTDGTVTIIDTDLGNTLVGAGGPTLYVFANDPPGESVCVDDCEAAWPPYLPSTLAGNFADRLGFIDRADGTQQATLDDRPLYMFVGDAEPGDTAGHLSAGVWFALDADGNPFE